MKPALLIILVTTIVFGLILVGCAGPAATPTSTPTQTVKPATSPTSTAISSPSPAPSPVSTAAKPIKLRYGSWSPSVDPINETARTFAKDLEQVSGGQVTMDLTYAAAVGKPPTYYDLAFTGVLDISHICPGYTPGRFPLMDIINYPIYFPDVMTANKTLWQLYKKGTFDKELSGVKPMWVFCTAPYTIYFTSKVAVLADFKGKKIRVPGTPESATIQALGGVPVKIELGDVYLGLQNGTIDGAIGSWGMGTTFKLTEVSKYAFDIKHCCYAFLMVMNKESYNKLPEAVRKYIDETGEKYSLMYAEKQGVEVENTKKNFAKVGGQTLELSTGETVTMKGSFKSVISAWANDLENKSIPAKRALDDLYSIAQGLGVQQPFVR